MHSSTSNSDAAVRPVTFLWFALFLVVCTAGVMATRPPSRDSGLSENTFWVRKLDASSQFDLVFGGCSRVYRGISPTVLKSAGLTQYRILNFGFSSLAYSDGYLDDLYSKLDPNSKTPVIVLGVQPMNLQKSHADNNRWMATRNTKPIIRKAIAAVPVPAETNYLLPIQEAWERHNGRGEQNFSNWQPLGFAATRRIADDPGEWEHNALKQAKHEPVDLAILDLLCRRIRAWRSRGITVFCCRVPAPIRKEKLQDKLTGFDPLMVSRQLEESGAVWLKFDQKVYPSIDGSHLRSDGAEEFSRDLAAAITQRLAQNR